jgi:hypothetical protein
MMFLSLSYISQSYVCFHFSLNFLVFLFSSYFFCFDLRLSTIVDHETSAVHQYAVSAVTAKSAVAKSGNLRATEAGKAYLALKEAERTWTEFFCTTAMQWL